MSLDGANFTMMKRDVAYYKAAYKRQLAVTNNLEQENAGCHIAIGYLKDQLAESDRYNDELNDMTVALSEHYTGKITALTDANDLLRSKVDEQSRTLRIKDHVMEARLGSSAKLQDELIAVMKDNQELREALDSWE